MAATESCLLLTTAALCVLLSLFSGALIDKNPFDVSSLAAESPLVGLRRFPDPTTEPTNSPTAGLRNTSWPPPSDSSQHQSIRTITINAMIEATDVFAAFLRKAAGWSVAPMRSQGCNMCARHVISSQRPLARALLPPPTPHELAAARQHLTKVVSIPALSRLVWNWGYKLLIKGRLLTAHLPTGLLVALILCAATVLRVYFVRMHSSVTCRGLKRRAQLQARRKPRLGMRSGITRRNISRDMCLLVVALCSSAWLTRSVLDAPMPLIFTSFALLATATAVYRALAAAIPMSFFAARRASCWGRVAVVVLLAALASQSNVEAWQTTFADSLGLCCGAISQVVAALDPDWLCPALLDIGLLLATFWLLIITSKTQERISSGAQKTPSTHDSAHARGLVYQAAKKLLSALASACMEPVRMQLSLLGALDRLLLMSSLILRVVFRRFLVSGAQSVCKAACSPLLKFSAMLPMLWRLPVCEARPVEAQENEPSSTTRTLSPWWTFALIVSSVVVAVGAAIIRFYPHSPSKARGLKPGRYPASKLVSTSGVSVEKLTIIHLETPELYMELEADASGQFTLSDDCSYFLFLDKQSFNSAGGFDDGEPSPSQALSSEKLPVALHKVAQWGNPSTFGTSWRTRKYEGIIHFHRPRANYGPHVAWFFPGFAPLLSVPDGPARLNEFSKSEDVSAQELCEVASAVYSDETQRTSALIGAFDKILGHSTRGHVFPGTTVDMCISVPFQANDRAYIVLAEVKNEIGSTASEPLMQCISEYAHIFKENMAACQLYAPSLLIQLVGAYLHIYGVVSTSTDILVDPLCAPVLLLATPFDKSNSVRCIRHLKALKRVVENLEAFYASAPALLPTGPIPMFPTVPSVNDLNFTSVVEGKANVFRATYQGRSVIVKFASQYCVEAHRLCAEHGFAPEILLVQPLRVRDDVAVIMEDCSPAVSASSVADGNRSEVQSKCSMVLKLLHDNGWVHGDFRPGNVLVRQTGSGLQVLVIDFDFAGRAGEAQYPPNLNPIIPWPNGAHPSAPLRPEHDLDFLSRLFTFSMEELHPNAPQGTSSKLEGPAAVARLAKPTESPQPAAAAGGRPKRKEKKAASVAGPAEPMESPQPAAAAAGRRSKRTASAPTNVHDILDDHYEGDDESPPRPRGRSRHD